MAMPGLFSPVPREGGMLVDGALTNPVPVSLGRPRLGHLGLFDFGRAAEAIKEGERAMSAALENLRVLGLNVLAGEVQRRS
jgi:predicted acylesterase/phospholipase RssA